MLERSRSFQHREGSRSHGKWNASTSCLFCVALALAFVLELERAQHLAARAA